MSFCLCPACLAINKADCAAAPQQNFIDTRDSSYQLIFVIRHIGALRRERETQTKPNSVEVYAGGYRALAEPMPAVARGATLNFRDNNPNSLVNPGCHFVGVGWRIRQLNR